jgi:hypothetical protein
MKKNYFLLFVLILFGQISFTQISTYYTFSESTSPYVELTGGLVAFPASGTSDDGQFTAPIGFNFDYETNTYTQLGISTNGGLGLVSLTSISYTNDLSSSSSNRSNMIAPLWDDHYQRSGDNGIITYLTTGTAPNRVFTVQWKNLSWRSSGKTVSFQAQLFEGSNNIQFNYGTNNSNESRSASIGFNNGRSGTDFISVTPGSPATSSFTTANNNINTTNYPGLNKSYLFTYTAPKCPVLSGLANYGVTSSSIGVTWAEAAQDSLWIIEYDTVGFTAGTGSVLGSSNDSATITGLSSNTFYHIYVRSICKSTGDTNTQVGPILVKTNCTSQLNGTYTLNPASAASATNFTTMADFMSLLANCGVSGPTTLNVSASSGPHIMGQDLKAYLGMSTTNKVVINGNGTTVNRGTGTYFLALNGVKNLTINNFIFTNETPASNVFGIMLRGGCDSITIKNNTLNLGITSTSSLSGGIIVSNSLTSYSNSGNNANNLTIDNNKIIGGYVGSSLYGTSSSVKSKGNKITNNTI